MSGTQQGGSGPHGDANRWRSRPVLAFVIGAFVVLAAVLGGMGLAWVVARMLPSPGSVAAQVGWWSAVLAASVVGAMAVERVTRLLLPLRALLRASMAFPGRPPARWRVAARRASTEQMLARLSDARKHAEATADADAMTRMLVLVADLQAHDPQTRGHAERVRMLCDLLTEGMGLPEHDRDRIRWAALLHDIGKIDVPKSVLRGSGSLSEEEWDLIKRHPQRGMELCAPLAGWLGEHAKGIVQHHERFDGKGYPAGVAGAGISRSARIISVVDAFEVMTGPRTYQRRKTVAQGRADLVANAGSQFDPAVVRAFLALSVRRLILISGPLSMLGALSLLRLQPAATAVLSASAMTAVVVGGGFAGFPTPRGMDVAEQEAAGDADDGAEDGDGAAGGGGAAADPSGAGGGAAGGVDSPDAPGGPDSADPDSADPDSADPSPGDPGAAPDSADPDSADADAAADPDGVDEDSPAVAGVTGTTGPGGTTGTTATAGGTAVGGTGGSGSGAGGTGTGTSTGGSGSGTGGTGGSGSGTGGTGGAGGVVGGTGGGGGTGAPAPAPAPTAPTPALRPPPPDTSPSTPGIPPPISRPTPLPSTAVVNGDAFTVPRNALTVLDVLDNDSSPDGTLDPSSVRVVEQPQHGDATVLPDGSILLDTQPGYRGPDQLTYEVCTTDGVCDVATVLLTIVTGEDGAIPGEEEDPSDADGPGEADDG